MKAGFVYILQEKPLVVAGSFSTVRQLSCSPGSFTLVYHNPGWIRPRNLWRWVAWFRAFQDGRRKLFIVTNEESEAMWLRLFRFRAQCFGHNLHIRENFYTPGSEAEPELFDAIYTARLSKQKRIYLAEKIRRLCVVTYEIGKDSWDLGKAYPNLKHAVSNSVFMDDEWVLRQYRRSICGLALSRSEGATWAAAEYLSVGLPVVTTKSRGGRDRYFESWFVKTVVADRDAVGLAVREWVKKRPTRSEIRGAFLEKVARDRAEYLQCLNAKCRLRVRDYLEKTNQIWGGSDGIHKHAETVESFLERNAGGK